MKKDFKEIFRERVEKNPKKYYATDILRDYGFQRKKCVESGRFFWTTDDDRDICGDADVVGKYTFLEEKIAGEELTYIDVWKNFKQYFEEKGYTGVDRYPVSAKWRDDTDFVAASIYNFQPHVVNGSVEPPANPLVIPQPCVRFNDVENVGVTMSHTTSFVMIGQHAFKTQEEWDQNKYFEDLLVWFLDNVNIPKDELILHEDVWVGGGNFGPCMEFFSGGLELANQVYMMYEKTHRGHRELPIKVLDMGMGHERVAWFTSRSKTMYETMFPETLGKAKKRVKTEFDEAILDRFIPYACLLNDDEAEDIEQVWENISSIVNMPKEDVKRRIKPVSDMYSVVEHARTLLISIHDGVLPSNVKGGHNLRAILRRALRIIEKNSWDVTLEELVSWHSSELKPLFPELSENLENVQKILRHEEKKWEQTKKKQKRLINKTLNEGNITEDVLLELYDSHGIQPSEVIERAKEQGITVKKPKQFWKKVSERHDQNIENKEAEEKRYEDIEKTHRLYYDSYDLFSFEGTVLHCEPVEDKDLHRVILNRSAFYPKSGGQLHDKGVLGDGDVVFVEAVQDVVVHYVTKELREGVVVKGVVDKERRIQLTQHHTATHIITGSAKRVLGPHVSQAGASKKMNKARLDITHYDALTPREEQKIEEEARSIIRENRPVTHTFLPRTEAEQKYGFEIYQGGAVPGKNIRIVSIEDYDVEACGGTHVEVTGDVEDIKILKSTKLQDGVVRLEFAAGKKGKEVLRRERERIETLKDLLSARHESHIPSRAKELFKKWKKSRKGKLDTLQLEKTEEFEGDIVKETAKRLKTQPKHVIKTVKKFLKQTEDNLTE